MAEGEHIPASTWDGYLGLNKRKWKLYQCSDCDPSLLEEGDLDDLEPDHPMRQYTQAALIVLPDDIDKPDYCPRCQSYLSLDEGREVFVTTGRP